MTTKPKRQDSGDPWLSLASAVVLQAVRDARAGDLGAGAWLTDDGLFYLDGLGLDMDPDYLQAWVKSGCRRAKKPPERPRLEKRADFPSKSHARRAVGDPGKAGQRERRL